MIRIASAPPPSILSSPLLRKHMQGLLDYLRRSPSERARRRPPVADDIFYGGELHDAVAERCLRKCVFCESEEIQPHVEHFRPIQVREVDGSRRDDHYAWLTYEWDNLVYVCDYCQRARRDQFPTKGARAPYLASFAEVRRVERPLLLDPYRDPVERHFDFLLTGHCRPLTARGAATFAIVDLGSERLRHLREAALSRMTETITFWADRDDPIDLQKAFDADLPFLGARLNVLRRALEGLPYGPGALRGPLRALPDRIASYLAGYGADRRDILRRLDEMRDVDARRAGDQDPFHYIPTLSEAPQGLGAIFSALRPRHVGRILVESFKGIERLDLRITDEGRKRRGAPCLMLLGENSTGKSSLLQGIALALLGGPQARRLKLDVDGLFRNEDPSRWDQLSSPTARVEVEFLFGDGDAAFVLPADTRRIFGSETPAALVLGYGPRRFFDPLRSEPVVQPYGRVRTLFNPLATIPYPGTWLNSLTPPQFEAVSRALRPILALSDKDDLLRHPDGRLIVLVGERPVPVERLSDGYRSVFVLAADIFRNMLDHFPDLESAHGIVLIDEIETHLHPRWKMQVMMALRSALPNVQFIVTTHDPLCLRGMEDGEVVVLQSGTDGTIRSVPDLPSLKGMRAEQLLTSDYFGLSSTIDPATELEVARFSAEVAKSPDAPVTNDVVSRITLGDSAGEQVVQEALKRFLAEREKPTGTLRSDIRASAVEAIYRALAEPLPLERRAADLDPT